jgi:hypothetical protein
MTLLLLACTGDDTTPPPAADVGALTAGALNPFPSMELVSDGHVAIPAGVLPKVEGGTDLDVSRVNWRTGFSRVQTSVAMLPVAIDPGSLSGSGALGFGGSVRMFDLDTGAEIPCFAELDAHPDAVDDGARALLVRPGLAMTPGHTIAVAVTAAVTSGGAPLSLPEWAAAKADPHYQDLEDTLVGLGVADVALAWDFPVGDGTLATRTVADVSVPAAYTFERVRDADTEEEGYLPPRMWKKIEGSFTADTWLVDDVGFSTVDGVPAAQGTAEAQLWAYIPESVRDASSAPVLVFGHGILAEPDDYLDDDDDESAVIDVADRLGAIVVGTVWRGLTADDQADTLEIAADLGRFPELTDRLTQGVSNNLSLIRLLKEGTLLDDPAFGGKADRSRIYWYGISLGSIEGAVTLANQSTIDTAVLHVGGSAWSTMLERSSNWTVFEVLVQRGIVDPYDRQLLFSLTQMLWDPVDPASYAEDLQGRTFLWQESIGDDQVPNLTTELLMRSIGVPLGTPAVTSPLDASTVALPTTGPAFTQFDPELGMPAEENRPSEVTHAHGVARTWEGTIAQTVHFYTSGGQVEHFCGADACSASNTGE